MRKDLNALSDQVYNVAKQLNDRRSARKLEEIRSTIRLLMTRRIVPLTKLQGELVDRLTGLELHLQPLQRQVNQSISHLKTIQYYINNQGGKIAQLVSPNFIKFIFHFVKNCERKKYRVAKNICTLQRSCNCQNFLSISFLM